MQQYSVSKKTLHLSERSIRGCLVSFTLGSWFGLSRPILLSSGVAQDGILHLIFSCGERFLCDRLPRIASQLLRPCGSLSAAFEAIADSAFMLITLMFYTREEQPCRISAWYAWNGIGVAGGGLIGKCLSQGDGCFPPNH